jgi:hypothetical protein
MRFLWAGNQDCHGAKCKVNWPTTCLPTELGGLGILELERFGGLRWLWYEWTNPEKPWSGADLPVDDTDRAPFAAATRVQVHNGRKALFWKSSWLNGLAPATLFPPLYRHSKRKNRTVAAALAGNRWIKDICHDLSSDLLTDFFAFWAQIEEQHLNLEVSEDDQIWWKPTTSVFTRLSQLMLSNSKDMRNRRSRQTPGSLGDRLNVSFSAGCCYRTRFGRLIGYYFENGRTVTFALCASETWRRPSI